MNNLYYGNSLIAWIVAGGLILLSLVIGKSLYWTFTHLARPLLQKSGRDLLILVVDMLEEPVVFMVVIIGTRLSLNSLTLGEDVIQVADYALAFVLTLTVTWLVTRMYNALHQRYLVILAQQTETTLDDHLLPLIKKGLNSVLWAIGIIVAMNNAGYNVTPVLAGLGIGGLAFALSVQHTFGNILGGLLVYTDGHFKIGDRIQFKGERGHIDGVVEDIGLRTTTVKTRYEGRYVNIPNSFLTDREVVNVESESGRQLFAVYKLAHDTTPEQIRKFLELLENAVKTTPGTKDLVITGLIAVSEIALDVMLLYWVESESSKVKTRTEINLKILEAMKNENIEFSDRTIVTYNKDVQY